jgi:hypothetical protein
MVAVSSARKSTEQSGVADEQKFKAWRSDRPATRGWAS